MKNFIARNPIWSLIIFVALAILVWMIFGLWPEWLVDTIGRKKIFLNALLNGITLGGLYFLVASGFTLIFGLMRNVNMAHGSLFLLGGYVGYHAASASGYWLLAFPVSFIVVAVFGILLQVFVFRRMEGDDLRQTLVTIGLS
ncbi:MAG: branched-chain amino acid ABC transporter permease, partial [Pseudomonadota bacterium]